MRGVLVTVALLLVGLSTVAHGQEHVLLVVPTPETVRVAPGGRVTFRLALENSSPYEVDGADVSFQPPANFSVLPAHAVRARVRPFGQGALQFSLDVRDVSPGSYAIPFRVIYTYCSVTKGTETECFQDVQDLALAVTVQEGWPGGAVSTRAGFPWEFVVPSLCFLLLAGAAIAWRVAGRSIVYGLLVLLAGGALAYGVVLRQPRQAQGIGTVLCTSCVGIEETRRESPALSSAARSALGSLSENVFLLVFYASWCRSCPYAEGMVEEMASVTDHLQYRLVDADQERDLARAHGVIASGRTVVPAIARVDDGEVIFGVQDLEARLLRLLGLAP